MPDEKTKRTKPTKAEKAAAIKLKKEQAAVKRNTQKQEKEQAVAATSLVKAENTAAKKVKKQYLTEKKNNTQKAKKVKIEITPKTKKQYTVQKKALAKDLIKAEKAAEKELQQQLMKNLEASSDFWSTLDNAGQIFPATQSPDMNSLFRLSTVLNKPVDKQLLQQAIVDITPRFPTITCALKQGIFWCFLEPPIKPIKVLPMTQLPCARMQIDSKNSMVRVTYHGNEIAVEYFHTATDGTGAVTFFNTLLHRYFCLVSGIKFNDYTNCVNYLDIPKPSELEDSYLGMDIKKRNKSLDKSAFHLKGTHLVQNGVRFIKGICSSAELKNLAAKYDATVGQFVTAVLAYTMQQMKKLQKGTKPVTISVAANLRPYYMSKTFRNFVSYFVVDAQEYTEFEDVVKTTIKQSKEQNNKEFYDELVTLNVRAQNNFFIKMMPLPLKNFMLKFAFVLVGERSQSMMLSNLGQINAPEFFKDFVKRYEFGLGGTKQKKVNASCCSFNGIFTITFASIIKERTFETIFFQKLSELGLEVCVESNMDFREGAAK